MTGERLGRALVRGLARVASWLYPARFRRTHAAAALIPALRIGRIDPSNALRDA